MAARTRAHGFRVGALMKLIPRGGPVAASRVRRVVGAVHSRHRVPVVAYAGFNDMVPITGVSIPRRFRPAPLKLFVIGGDVAAVLLDDPDMNGSLLKTADIVFGAFELLDFDPL